MAESRAVPVAARDGWPESLRGWAEGGQYLALYGNRVFTRVDGPKDAPTVVLLHGFPGSSYEWHGVAARLATDYHVVTFDFPGFGLSSKPPGEEWTYSLVDQADVVEGVLQDLSVRSAHLVAHDMGTSVATELIARRERRLLPTELETLTLTNGSVFIEMAKLTPSQKILRGPFAKVFAKLANEDLFTAQVRRLMKGEVAPSEVAAMWSLLKHDGGREAMRHAIRYVEERSVFAARWHGPLRRLDVPALVLWGTEDPVAVRAIGERLAREIPGATHAELEGIGHWPMLEAAARFAQALSSFLADHR